MSVNTLQHKSVMAALVDTRNDLHLTSAGRGHEYRDGFVFPPLDFQRSALNPLPNSLTSGDNVQDRYITTTGSTHDYKSTHLSEKYLSKKAPGHWRVNYAEDMIKKLNVKPQRKPLSMGFQSSEMKSQFAGQPGLSMATKFSSNLQPPTFQHHQQNGPLKSLVSSGHNRELAGNKFGISDRGVLSYHGDLYLSTTQKDHRDFTREEKSAYPQKNYATYWECENYPKAWGHGSKQNPLPVDSVPREEGPMRDHIWFKTATTIPRLPKPLQPVPNNGLCSEVKANFTNISDEDRVKLFHCPVATPWELRGAGPDEIFSVPKMYNTEYQSYACGKPVPV